MPIDDWFIHSFDNSLKKFLVVVVSSDDKNKEDDKDKNHGKDMIIDSKKFNI